MVFYKPHYRRLTAHTRAPPAAYLAARCCLAIDLKSDVVYANFRQDPAPLRCQNQRSPVLDQCDRTCTLRSSLPYRAAPLMLSTAILTTSYNVPDQSIAIP